jgi:hypothetical protein
VTSFEPDSRARTTLAWIVGISTLLRLWFSSAFFGFHTGDDVEVVQAGFMRALDYEYTPWAIRNLFFSDVVVSPFLWLASQLGIDSIRTLTWIASFGTIALASLNIILVYLLARRWLEEGWVASLAAGLYAVHWLPLGFGSTVYPRTASTTCVLVAALLLHRIRRPEVAYAVAGSMVGVAFAIRYSEAIFLLPLLALAMLGKAKPPEKIRRALALGFGFAASTVITIGLWDLITWGRPYSSLVSFADYTLIQKQSSAMVKAQPFYWYLWRLPKWLPLTVIPFFFGWSRRERLVAPLLFSVLPLVVLSLIHYKTMRYLQGIVPFLAIAVAAGFHAWWMLGRRRAAVILLSLSVLFGVTFPTFVAEKSMAAVLAAESMAATGGVEIVALSQAWAYGEDLHLGWHTEVRELGPYPGIVDLEREVSGCDRVALYRDRLRQAPDIEPWLRKHGYEVNEIFEWGWSRPVVVFSRASPPPVPLE